MKNKVIKKYDNELSEREKLFLKIIVEEYINTASPIGSNFLLESNKNLKYSSATVRNIMSQLEKKGYLLKNHNSSGRFPSTLGFKYYEEKLVEYDIPINLKNKLLEIFKKRNQNIDEVIEESLKLISEIIQLPTIVTTIHETSIIKKIELIKLDENKALLISVFSDGNLVKNVINSLKPELMNDISICVQILNDRLTDLNLQDINNQLNIISKIIKNKVHDYEFIMQQVIHKIFNKNIVKAESNVIAIKNVLKQKEFKDMNKLNYVLNLLDNTSIWEQLALQTTHNTKPKITFGNEVDKNYDDIAIISNNIKINNSSSKKQISIIGPTRMKYGEVIALLNFIKKELEENE